MTGNATKDGRRLIEGGHTESLPPVLFRLDENSASLLGVRRLSIADNGRVMQNMLRVRDQEEQAETVVSERAVKLQERSIERRGVVARWGGMERGAPKREMRSGLGGILDETRCRAANRGP